MSGCVGSRAGVVLGALRSHVARGVHQEEFWSWAFGVRVFARFSVAGMPRRPISDVTIGVAGAEDAGALGVGARPCAGRWGGGAKR